MSPFRRLSLLGLLLTLAAAAAVLPSLAAGGPAGAPVATGFTFVKFPAVQPACTGVGLRGALYFTRDDCGFGYATVSGTTADSTVTAELIGADGSALDELETSYRAAEDAWEFDFAPEEDWPAGPVRIRMKVAGAGTVTGEGTVFVNQLGVAADVPAKTGGYRPGDAVPVAGRVFEQRSVATGTREDPAAGATLELRVFGPDGAPRGTFGPFTADDEGDFTGELPPAATEGLSPTRATGYKLGLRFEAVDAAHENPLSGGTWAANDTPAGSFSVSVPPPELVLDNSFVSSVGWVKPGEEYPFKLRISNFTAQPRDGARVTVPAPDGTTFTEAGPGATIAGGTLTWEAGTIPAAGEGGPAEKELVVVARADTLAQDPQIVWKNLSSIATLAYDGGPDGLRVQSHGPKVIPPRGGYETARYGDRPFPVVPVDYSDRKHSAANSGGRLAGKLNDPEVPGSTFNLFQEISYGQLFPNGTVPSNGIASAGWDYEPGFAFTTNEAKPDTCRGLSGATLGDGYQQANPERIRDGWYQLPSPTDYYGDDSKGSALIGAQAGVGALADIDSACGPPGKAVYDAAQIADPEIDYSDYDTDKDGVVDFFMMVFTGAGGNGTSQPQGYDNIWPHSYTLEAQFRDEATGLTGYISDDQLRDLEDRPLWFTDERREFMTTDDTGDDLKVFVRVGPYNVNPETAIARASVISHEYGHSLGLPDYYSTGTRETYGTWNLMASDLSQNMDVIAKKELGWIVPRVLRPGETKVSGWQDTKRNTHQIDWRRPDGTPYTLAGDGVDNGEGYVATLPGRVVIDPAEVPSGDHVFWSGSGDDFGCPPLAGHNLDIALPGLAEVPAGTPIRLSFKSRWDTEWDYDYGFVMTTTDGRDYKSRPSEKGHTTPQSENPNDIPCQARYGNGLTGSSGSYADDTVAVDRPLDRYPAARFVDDEFRLDDLAGQAGATLRFTYATDSGTNRPGWFIDDVRVTAGDRVIYEGDFEAARDPSVYNGGCREGLQTAAVCTEGWTYLSSRDGSPADHAYLLELRDRSGFDAHGRGESERGDITFAPGVLLTYTDEAHGYGNVGTSNPPAQTPLDSQPEPESDTPNLDDAAFTAAPGDQSFSDGGEGHVDNYSDSAREDNLWRFDAGCLSFDVDRLAGDTIGPEAPGAYDLAGDVTFTLGKGCGAFNYGTGPEDVGVAPRAIASAKPATVRVGEPVTFDGSASRDDKQAPEALGYAWDFDADGTEDARGSSARHAYARPGRYEARLTVTDRDRLSATATVPVTVTEGPVQRPIESGPGRRGCTTDAGFSRVRFVRRGGGARFEVERRMDAPFAVDVFQVAAGRRAHRERLVARFGDRTGSFGWSARRSRGGGRLSDGIYFARLTLRSGRVRDVRRIALRRRGGRFTVLRPFHRRDSCTVLRSYKLSSPAFGGTTGRSLGIAFRAGGQSRVEVRVLRGRRLVRRFAPRVRRPGRTHRLRLPSRGLRRGTYRIELRLRRGGRTTRAVLTSRKL